MYTHTHLTTEAGGRRVHVHTHTPHNCDRREEGTCTHTTQLRQEEGGYMYTHTHHTTATGGRRVHVHTPHN